MTEHTVKTERTNIRESNRVSETAEFVETTECAETTERIGKAEHAELPNETIERAELERTEMTEHAKRPHVRNHKTRGSTEFAEITEKTSSFDKTIRNTASAVW